MKSVNPIFKLFPFLAVWLVFCTAVQAQQSQAWPIAVVFTQLGDKLTYKGTVSNPVFPQVLVQARTTGVSSLGNRPTADAEIWLVRDGGMVGVWYSSRQRAFGYITGSESQNSYKDNGSIRHLVMSAHWVQGQIRPRPGEIAVADWAHSEPASLGPLVTASSTVAVGRVVGILRMAHTPMNSDFDMQHTVYLFAVEKYLKVSDASGTRPILKIWQEGGDLTWSSVTGGPGGRGWEVFGDPMLNIGDRYCLFLKQQPDPSGTSTKHGYVEAMNNGVVGKAAEFDELVATSPSVGKLLLRHNEVLPASVADPLPVLPNNQANLPAFYGHSEQGLIAIISKLVSGNNDAHRSQSTIRP